MPLSIGQKAPNVRLQDQAGKQRRLRDDGGRRLILYFFPKVFTPGCTGESCDFRDSSGPLQAAGFTIVGVSPDPVERLAQFKTEYDLPFDLLADPDHEAAEAFGAWGTKKNYGREYEGLIRSTFVFDAEGRLERVYRNVRAKGHVARLRRELLDEA